MCGGGGCSVGKAGRGARRWQLRALLSTLLCVFVRSSRKIPQQCGHVCECCFVGLSSHVLGLLGCLVGLRGSHAVASLVHDPAPVSTPETATSTCVLSSVCVRGGRLGVSVIGCSSMTSAVGCGSHTAQQIGRPARGPFILQTGLLCVCVAHSCWEGLGWGCIAASPSPVYEPAHGMA